MNMLLKKKIKALLIKFGLYDLTVNILNGSRYWFIQLSNLPLYLRSYIYNYIVSYIPCHIFRLFMLRHMLKIKVGKGTFVHLGAFFLGKITIGSDVVIGRDVHILGEVYIGNHVSISAETHIIATSHDKNSNKFVGINKPIVIDDYVWTGTRSMILLGTHICTGGGTWRWSCVDKRYSCISGMGRYSSKTDRSSCREYGI